MSSETNTVNNIDGKINTDKEKNTKNYNKDSKKPINVIFFCEACKRIPLIIFSEKIY